MKYQKLSNNPIVEAALMIGFSPLNSLTPEQFCSEVSTLFGPGAKSETIKQQEFKFSLGANLASVDSGKTIGCRLSFEDRKQVCQIFLDKFVFSQLPPYDEWNVFKKEAFDIYGVLKKKYPQLREDKFGLRYINRFELSADKTIHDVLERIPSEAELDRTAQLLEFSCRQTFAQEQYKFVLNRAMQVDGKGTPFCVFDIDVSTSFADKSCELLFDEMKQKQRDLFFSGITEKEREARR